MENSPWKRDEQTKLEGGPRFIRKAKTFYFGGREHAICTQAEQHA